MPGSITVRDSAGAILHTHAYYQGQSQIRVNVHDATGTSATMLVLDISDRAPNDDLAIALAPMMSMLSQLLEVANTERDMYRVRAEEWERIAHERSTDDEDSSAHNRDQ